MFSFVQLDKERNSGCVCAPFSKFWRKNVIPFPQNSKKYVLILSPKKVSAKKVSSWSHFDFEWNFLLSSETFWAHSNFFAFHRNQIGLDVWWNRRVSKILNCAFAAPPLYSPPLPRLNNGCSTEKFEIFSWSFSCLLKLAHGRNSFLEIWFFRPTNFKYFFFF